MGFTLNEDRFVTPLQNVTKQFVVTIELLREDSVQKLHSARQVGLRGFDEDVVVIRHQTEGVTNPSKSTDYLSEGI